MHKWGDDWFRKYGNEFDRAIYDFEQRIKKWAKCGVCGKEKYGTYRDDYFRMWDGSLSVLFFGYKAFRHSKFENLVWKLDHYLVPVKKTQFGWYKVGLANLNRTIGLVKLVNKWQARQLNKAAQITCKEHPDLVDELLMCVCFYKCIKPCKWGNIDGEAIHKKYWKPLKEDKDEQ